MPKQSASVCVLFDGDNVQAALAHTVISEARSYGEVTIRRVYGDFGAANFSSWRKVAPPLGIRPSQQFPKAASGKNAADAALIVDAMDILHQKQADVFCIVASDCDYTPLAMRLKDAGCRVIVFGGKTTPKALRSSCSNFIRIDLPRQKASESTVIVHHEMVIAAIPEAGNEKAQPPSKASHIKADGNDAPAARATVAAQGRSNTASPAGSTTRSGALPLPAPSEPTKKLLVAAYNAEAGHDGKCLLSALAARFLANTPDITVKQLGFKKFSALVCATGLFDIAGDKNALTATLRRGTLYPLGRAKVLDSAQHRGTASNRRKKNSKSKKKLAELKKDVVECSR